MKDEILPIGSIVTINKTDVMICAYLDNKKDVNGKHYDYAGCLYPNGMGAEAVLINKKDIERVKFIGFQDGRFTVLKSQLEKQNEK